MPLTAPPITDEEMEDTLLQAGWEFDRNGWVDPMCKEKNSMTPVKRLKHPDGTHQDLTQHIRPPIMWWYELKQAYGIQLKRV